jgi:hypothetical protein
MIGQTPTSLKVNDMWIRENLAKAERYHALTRNEADAEKQPITYSTVRMPRISLFRRLATALPRPA